MSSSPRPDGHRRRRSWTAERKQRYLAEYEVAAETGQGAAFLRREGLYSSLISEWRRQRDAGLLDGLAPGQPVGRPSPEQAENARLKARIRDLESRLSTTETALSIMGKAHELLEQISESSDTQPRRGRR